MAFLAFAYDLYTLEHHSLLPPRLVERLKLKDQFQGARYETYVAAAFVRAGFNIALEDESDISTSHCEFIAVHRATGSTYSVEAKSRHRAGLLGQAGSPKPVHEIEADISGLLSRALRKNARNSSIVFIDVNCPPEERALLETDWFNKLASQLKRLEATQPATPPFPCAFVFLTNYPYHYVGSEASVPAAGVVFTGFNMPEFKAPPTGLVASNIPQ